jgi:hypothetical protein
MSGSDVGFLIEQSEGIPIGGIDGKWVDRAVSPISAFLTPILDRNLRLHSVSE